MLYDKDFLLKLDKYQHKVIYARITALTFQETPIEYIEGRVTQGSISLDGASAVRRSCSLTIAAPDFNYSDYYWGLNTKFKLEVGVENYIDTRYPDIIWFNQGIYLITSFNTTRNTTNLNITIQGKDKMCLLNGEIGGTIESSVDFGTIEEETIDGMWITKKIPIQEIIKNIVHTYAGEPYHNIIINDLDTYGLELLEYRYDTPLFLYREKESSIYDNAIIGGSTIKGNGYNSQGALISNATGKPLSSMPSEAFESLVDTLTVNASECPYIRLLDENDNLSTEEFCFAKIGSGETAGYRLTDLIYAGDLIAKAGDSITSVLDKIKTMLTEFEYFYNTDGQFVFQKKQSIKENVWHFNSQVSAQERESLALSTEHAYQFHGNNLLSSINNNPNLLNMRNDYSIWGERETISGAKIPIHLRYAIDKKPTKYTSISVNCANAGDKDYNSVKDYNDKYNTNITGQSSTTFLAEEWDWRELIYQMALDYYKYNFLDDFELKVAEANPDVYPSGRTGYEQYYIDLYSFWRELYWPQSDISFIKSGITTLQGSITNLQQFLATLEQDINSFIGIEKKEDQIDKINQWESSTAKSYLKKFSESITLGQAQNDPLIYFGLLKDLFFREQNELLKHTNKYDQRQSRYQFLSVDDYYPSNHQYKNWNKKVYEHPDQLNFWFDFLDGTGELAQFNVQSVGSRPKVVNDTNIKSIYVRETPSVIYGTSASQNSQEGFRFIQISEVDVNYMFTFSAQGKSAKDKLDELIYQHGYCIENVTINAIPIYYLEPNVRIYLHDEETGLDGDYLVSKLTIPLTHNGTMSITATKAAQNIL